MNFNLPDLSEFSTFVFLYAMLLCVFLFVMLNKFSFKKDKDGVSLSVDDDEIKEVNNNERDH